MGNNLVHQGELARATAALTESVGVARELGDGRVVAMATTYLGDAAWAQGHDAAAGTCYDEALALFRAAGDRNGEADGLVRQGALACARGDVAAASALCDESLALFDGAGDRRGRARALSGQGDVAQARGDGTQASRLCRQSLAVYRALGDRAGMAAGVENAALFLLMVDHAERAACLLAAADATRTMLHIPVAPRYRARYDEAIRVARARLGDDGFAAAWAAGRLLALTDAVDRILAGTTASPDYP